MGKVSNDFEREQKKQMNKEKNQGLSTVSLSTINIYCSPPMLAAKSTITNKIDTDSAFKTKIR